MLIAPVLILHSMLHYMPFSTIYTPGMMVQKWVAAQPGRGLEGRGKDDKEKGRGRVTRRRRGEDEKKMGRGEAHG